ncbi:hypothetical protein, partial [Treponema socranskii]|uniref:hypothetical protein n=1 Tax=Treponema socranskii TaxID=53419 RepID=UPI0023F50405
MYEFVGFKQQKHRIATMFFVVHILFKILANWNYSKSSRLHLLALRTRSLPRSKSSVNFCLTISFSGIFCPSDFLMI